jgi:hypothetical protein
MQLMKQKINLATRSVRNLVTVSGSFLTIIGAVSAADAETQVLSPQNPSTIPHRAMQPSQSSQSPNNSLLAELASQSSTGEHLRDGKGATPEAEDLTLLAQRTCQAMSPVKILLPKIKVKGSQGGAD